LVELRRRLEREGGLDAAGVLFDRAAEAAFVIEAEARSFATDHIDAGADIRQNIVGRAGDAERVASAYSVIPAKAGIQIRALCACPWIPACAGMTSLGELSPSNSRSSIRGYPALASSF